MKSAASFVLLLAMALPGTAPLRAADPALAEPDGLPSAGREWLEHYRHLYDAVKATTPVLRGFKNELAPTWDPGQNLAKLYGQFASLGSYFKAHGGIPAADAAAFKLNCQRTISFLRYYSGKDATAPADDLELGMLDAAGSIFGGILSAADEGKRKATAAHAQTPSSSLEPLKWYAPDKGFKGKPDPSLDNLILRVKEESDFIEVRVRPGFSRK